MDNTRRDYSMHEDVHMNSADVTTPPQSAVLFQDWGPPDYGQAELEEGIVPEVKPTNTEVHKVRHKVAAENPVEDDKHLVDDQGATKDFAEITKYCGTPFAEKNAHKQVVPAQKRISLLLNSALTTSQQAKLSKAGIHAHCKL